jgi:hypothetical protein
MQKVFTQEVPEFAEEYIDEDLPESALDVEQAAKPLNETNDKDHKKTNFSEDRFTKLFQPRNRNKINNNSPVLPKFNAKPKPTLPSFIKKAPPIIRVTPSTPSPAQNQRFNQRTSTSTQRTTTTRTPSRGTNGNNGRRTQLNNSINNRSPIQSTTSPSTTDSSGRRRFGSSNRRFNANATIPATTSRPRRF